jgi:glucokinase
MNEGSVETAGRPKAVLGAGTGLGVGYLTSHSGQYEVWGSEGGHVDFAPKN